MDYKKLTELVAQAKDGDEDAFNELYEEKKRSIMFETQKYLGNYPDVEDVAQEIGVFIFENLNKLKNPELFNAWLNKIIIGKCYKAVDKKEDWKKLMNIEDFHERVEDKNVNNLPDRALLSEEESALVMEIVDSLPPKYSTPLRFFVYEEMSQKEIAMVLGISMTTVSTRIQRARGKIVKEYAKRTQGKTKKVRAIATFPILQYAHNWQEKKWVMQEQVDRVAETVRRIIADLPTTTTAAGGAAMLLETTKMGMSAAAPAAHGLSFAAKVLLIVTTTTVITTSVVIGVTDPFASQAEKANQPSPYSSVELDDRDSTRFPDDRTDGELEIDESPNNNDGDLSKPGLDDTADSGGIDGTGQDGNDNENENIAVVPGGENRQSNNAEPVKTPVSGSVKLKNNTGAVIGSGNLLSSIKAEILNGNSVIASTTTNQAGEFAFSNLSISGAGNYVVRITLPQDLNVGATPDNPDGRKTIYLAPGQSVAGIVFYVNLNKSPDGSISLTGNDCDCGHVNPTRAVINDSSVIATTQSWQIIRQSDNTVIYSGTGAVITTELTALLDSKADGVYIISYIHRDESGNSAELKQKFLIDSGEITPHQYS